MTLSELAGRLLKGTGHSQPPPSTSQSLEACLSLERVGDSSFLALPDTGNSQVSECGGMVGNSFGEPKGHSINASTWAKIRPLSDIRELTEPSLADTVARKIHPDNHTHCMSRPDLSRKTSVASKRRPSIDVHNVENREPERKKSFESKSIRSTHRARPSRTPSPPSPGDNNSISSIYSIPPSSVPPRSSSRTRARNASKTRPPLQQAVQRAPLITAQNTAPNILLPLPSAQGGGHTIPRRGQSQSPLQHVAARLDPVSHDTNRRIPSKTFIREPLSKELLEFPSHRHPRIELGLDLSAGTFVGGGSIEGTVQIKVDDAERIRHRRTLDIARISIDLLGLEEMSGNRRCVFLNLATELIDENNPPPANMVDKQELVSFNDLFWHLMPSDTNLAFNISLPLNVGPPPFNSKNARIRYVLCVSLLIRDHGRQYIVRTSEDVTVLSVYDRRSLQAFSRKELTAK
jgi:hypothetical protein